jgi:hypothetical protein
MNVSSIKCVFRLYTCDPHFELQILSLMNTYGYCDHSNPMARLYAITNQLNGHKK